MLTKLALLLSLILSEAVVSESKDIKVDNNGDMCSVKKSSTEVLFFAENSYNINPFDVTSGTDPRYWWIPGGDC